MWFAKSIEEVLKEVNVDVSTGLSEKEAAARLAKHVLMSAICQFKQKRPQLFIAKTTGEC